jgi:putative phosphoribosyl transferase
MAQGKRETHDINVPPIGLPGTLDVPRSAYALVVFAHGSGSSRLSPRNRAVAIALNRRGIATLLFDLLTPAEEADRSNVFNIPLLASRLVERGELDRRANVSREASAWVVCCFRYRESAFANF